MLVASAKPLNLCLILRILWLNSASLERNQNRKMSIYDLYITGKKMVKDDEAEIGDREVWHIRASRLGYLRHLLKSFGELTLPL